MIYTAILDHWVWPNCALVKHVSLTIQVLKRVVFCSEEGYRVILANSNPATIMTDPDFADRTYIEPLTPEILARIIAREKPDAVLPTLGRTNRAEPGDGTYLKEELSVFQVPPN